MSARETPVSDPEPVESYLSEDGWEFYDSNLAVLPPPILVKSEYSIPENPSNTRNTTNTLATRCIFVILLLCLLLLTAIIGGIIGKLLFCGQDSQSKCPTDISNVSSNSEPCQSILNVQKKPEHTIDGKLPSETQQTTLLNPLFTNQSQVAKEGRKLTAIISRLDKRLRPLHYDLTFELTETNKLKGRVAIVLTSTVARNKIILHSIDPIKIEEVSLYDQSNHRSRVELNKDQPWLMNSTDQTLIIYPDPMLKSHGRYLLEIYYSTDLCGNPAINCNEGPFLSFATKLEPMMARSLFPCFDEPAFKASYNVSVAHKVEDNLTVLSNEALCSREKIAKGWYLDNFCKSPPMSTYTMALAVGKFALGCNETNTGLNICLYVPEKTEEEIPFALQTAIVQYERLLEYFEVPYPLSKLDFVGSHNYKTAAMENWGLIIHTMASLISSYGQRKLMVVRIITHELVHQWFGNLVTMEWWDDIWLNEGFAQYFSYIFETEQKELLSINYFWRLQTLMELQASPHEQIPLVRNFSTPSGVTKSFHRFGFYHLYIKGATIVRMIDALMGKENFRAGLINYLHSHAFGVSNRQDLWKHLDAAMAGRSVSIGSVMNPWTTNPGYPQFQMSRDHQTGTIILTQSMADERSTTDFSHKPKTDGPEPLWPVPITYLIQGEQPTADKNTNWLSSAKWPTNVTFAFREERLRPSAWILLNPDFQFMYRVNYDRQTWRQLIHQLQTQPHVIPIKLLMDGKFYLYYKRDTLPLYLTLLSYLDKETETLPWISGITSLYSLFCEFRETGALKQLQEFFQPVTQQMFLKLSAIFGPTGDLDEEETTLLGDSTNYACKLLCATNHPKCVFWAKNQTGITNLISSAQMQPRFCGYILMCYKLMHYSSSSEIQEFVAYLDTIPLNNSSYLSDIYTLQMGFCVANYTLTKTLLKRFDEAQMLPSLDKTLIHDFSIEPIPFFEELIWNLIKTKGLAARSIIQQIFASVHPKVAVGPLSSPWATKSARSFIKAPSVNYDIDRQSKIRRWAQEVSPSIEAYLGDKAKNRYFI